MSVRHGSQFKKDMLEAFTECPGCGRSKENLGLGNCLSMDHLLPRSLGGHSEPENLLVVCRRCNSFRGDQYPWDWYGQQHHIYKNGYPKVHEDRMRQKKENKLVRQSQNPRAVAVALQALLGWGPVRNNPQERGVKKNKQRATAA